MDKEKIINVIERFGELIGQAIEIIGPIAIDLIDMGADLAMPVFDVIEDIFNLIGDFIDDLGSEGFSEAINNLGENILESLPDEVKQVIETLSSIVSDIITGITSVITFISDVISGLAKDFGVFAEYAGKSVDAITSGEIFDDSSVYNRPLNETLGAIFGQSATGQHGEGSEKSFDVTVTPTPHRRPGGQRSL